MDVNEVMDALRVIKEVCHNSLNCYSCPFRGSDGDDYDCTISNVMPSEWRLVEEEEAWRAFR